jgi:hypothetical protein
MGEVVRLKAGVSIREFKQRLAKLPLSVAHTIAQQAAPMLTRFAQEANARRENVYGDPYPEGADGAQLDLVHTGDTRRTLRFVVNGTIMRCALGPRYARFLIGKYRILPIGDRSDMPSNWRRALDELARTVVERPNLVAA